MNTSFQISNNRTDEWYTPRELVNALGKFDLDPCAPHHGFYTADKCYDRFDDGLKQNWGGRVFCNPPYNRKLIVPFITKMAEHGNGIALIFNRMDIALWHEVIFPSADAMLVMRGRVRFINKDGKQGAAGGCGSVLVAWGEDNARVLRDSGIVGKYIKLN